MSRNRLFYSLLVSGFLSLLGYALWQELVRNEAQIQVGISGVIQATPETNANIVRTDNAYIYLFEPGSLNPAAIRVLNPFIPPVTFRIGQADAGKPLQGAYRMLVITDKDGNPEHPSRGEVRGILTAPMKLGSEEVEYLLDRPFTDLPPDLTAGSRTAAAVSISGTVDVVPEMREHIESSDRMVIMLFDPKQGRPAAFKILPAFRLPQSFAIGAADAMPGTSLSGSYSLRILTDKNQQPFESAPGEVIGRSSAPIALGTENVRMLMNMPYSR